MVYAILERPVSAEVGFHESLLPTTILNQSEAACQPKLVSDESGQQSDEQVHCITNSTTTIIITIIIIAVIIIIIIIVIIRGHLAKWLGLGLWHSLCSFFLLIWLHKVNPMYFPFNDKK